MKKFSIIRFPEIIFQCIFINLITFDFMNSVVPGSPGKPSSLLHSFFREFYEFPPRF